MDRFEAGREGLLLTCHCWTQFAEFAAPNQSTLKGRLTFISTVRGAIMNNAISGTFSVCARSDTPQ